MEDFVLIAGIPERIVLSCGRSDRFLSPLYLILEFRTIIKNHALNTMNTVLLGGFRCLFWRGRNSNFMFLHNGFNI